MFHSHFQRYLTIQIDSVLNMSEILDSFNKVGNNFDTNFYLISNMTVFGNLRHVSFINMLPEFIVQVSNNYFLLRCSGYPMSWDSASWGLKISLLQLCHN